MKLLVVFFAMIVAQVVGSIYNISYNLVHLRPLLSLNQQAHFEQGVQYYNLLAYPFFISLWAWVVFSLRKGKRSQQRRVINLPWWATLCAAAGWLGSLVVLLWQLLACGEELSSVVIFHLTVSILTAMAIALSLSYLAVDLLRLRYVFPYFFDGSMSPRLVKGGHGLSVTGRGVLWVISASFCPILALLLLLVSPAEGGAKIGFAVAVAGAGIFFALTGMLLLRTLIATPVDELRQAADSVREGRLEVSVNNLRSDEFGVLADAFNSMVVGLREKEEIRAKFGMHVGEEIANELLKDEADLVGVERTVSVLFADIRGFTTRCESIEPSQAVELLNLYHEAMTGVIQAHGGMVIQLAGDGCMALFGATGKDPQFAEHAVESGAHMLEELTVLNPQLEEKGFDPVVIGIGVHTGPAVIGTIGSPGRMEYTAIGDTVNTASRIEGMTKELGKPLLLSESTWDSLSIKPKTEKLALQGVKGREGQIQLYAVDDC